MPHLKFNLDNYIYNLKKIKEMIKESKICLVLKSDAYGFGLNNLLEQIFKLNIIDYVAITENKEAKIIREYSKKINILRIRPANLTELKEGFKYNIEELLDSNEKIKLINKINKKTPVHLSLDMGINNLGMKIEDLNIDDIKNLNIKGIMTHFPDIVNLESDNFKNFKNLYEILKQNYFRNIIAHVANTSNFLFHRENIYLDMIRIGRLQYGMTKSTKNFLKPTLEWKVNYVSIKNVKKNDTIGYNYYFKALSDMIILIIPYGYNNGYPILENNNQYVMVNNTRCKVVGKVNMNLIQVDISNIKEDIKDIYLLGNGLYLEDIKSNNYYRQGMLLLNISRNNDIIFIKNG